MKLRNCESADTFQHWWRPDTFTAAKNLLTYALSHISSKHC